MLKNILILLLLLIAGGAGFWLANGLQGPSFEDLSARQMYEKITEERDLAIQKAVESGDYRCSCSPF